MELLCAAYLEYCLFGKTTYSSDILDIIICLSEKHAVKLSCMDLYDFNLDSVSYFKIVERLFSDKITWGRIIVLFCWTGALAKYAFVTLNKNIVSQLAKWQNEFMTDALLSWIIVNGGLLQLKTFC